MAQKYPRLSLGKVNNIIGGHGKSSVHCSKEKKTDISDQLIPFNGIIKDY